MEPTIAILLKEAQQTLSQLDAEILLAKTLVKNRSYLHTYPEQVLLKDQQKHFRALVAKRAEGMPIAYLTGRQEFWSMDLRVTTETLIPRPETELLVEQALQLPLSEGAYIADLGTGSGAIALALALEKPQCLFYATDINPGSLMIAKQNADSLNVKNVYFKEGFWCEALPPVFFDMIISNPPYIAEDDPHIESAVMNYEPQQALFSAEQGMADIKSIVMSAFGYLKPGAYLLIEHGFQQGGRVRQLFAEVGYTNILTQRDLAGLERVTLAQRPQKID